MPQFVSLQIGSPYGKAYFLAHAKQTTGIATINQKVLKAFPVLVLPIEQQVDIARRLTDEIEKCQELRARIHEQFSVIQSISQVVLRNAFPGTS